MSHCELQAAQAAVVQPPVQQQQPQGILQKESAYGSLATQQVTPPPAAVPAPSVGYVGPVTASLPPAAASTAQVEQQQPQGAGTSTGTTRKRGPKEQQAAGAKKAKPPAKKPDAGAKDVAGPSVPKDNPYAKVRKGENGARVTINLPKVASVWVYAQEPE